ncbi:proline dehydrogenase family protein [Microbacterium halophytorum]|uniref:proline dehydrogenase family protein n=1 Tax=Microbacterium halophytorum TaxID=2067568 RepID=UPI0018E09FB4|nr:bifunctional proline dehydrogenase/L-glutamate gamma-semialdehyde dehydrogenase [Microbacterium halophytorum]
MGSFEDPLVAEDLVDRAAALARTWVSRAANASEDAGAERLAGVLRDDKGLEFTVGFVDGVMRPESHAAAARSLARIAPLAPRSLPVSTRAAIRLGGMVGTAAPAAVIPAARRGLRSMVGHLIADARPEKLDQTIGRIRAQGQRANLNLLGEAVLGEKEAGRRLAGIRRLVERDDVDYVSVKVSSIISRVSMWAFDDTVDRVVERLTPLYELAASNGTFVGLDTEEYRDLDLTIAVFRRLLDQPQLSGVRAGIVLQTYLPDALPALRELTVWARGRVDAGGEPIKVRLVKGANLPMERVEAAMHGWEPATYDTKLDTDADYIRCLNEALAPDAVRAVRVGVAGHNLFDIGYAHALAEARGVSEAVEFEMLLGMAQGQAQAVAETVGPVRLYVPVVEPAEFDVAIGYLVRRLEENASGENFLSAAYELVTHPDLFERERERFADSVRRARAHDLGTGPRRTGRRAVSAEAPAEAPAGDEPLTAAVLGISRGSSGDDAGDDAADGFVDTAEFHGRAVASGGAPGFRNTPDTDPSVPENRDWAKAIMGRVPDSDLGRQRIEQARVTTRGELNSRVLGVRYAAQSWAATPASERADILRRAARELEARRADLIEVAASETGKVLAEADAEVSEAIDFANYYAANAGELDRVPGARFVPSAVTVVAPPWNFPLAIPAGGVLAALAAGSGVVLKPAPQARRCAAVIADALWSAGVPETALDLIDIDEGELGRALIEHPHVDRVILTGSFETAELFRSWRPDLPIHAETSGKNAIVIAPSADLDLAARDLVQSAFGHAGQKCSAASLAILIGPVGRSKRFARQLTDATRSLRVGPPSDPLSEIGPVIEVPEGKLDWALTTLDEGEDWLIRPRELPGGGRRYWTPGIRIGVKHGSRFHLEEFFGPVLGVMHASSMEQAIRMQNAVEFGLTAGLFTQDPRDLEMWLDGVEAGNLYVNRGITGAIVQRQPFGGWKRSSVGTGTKAGGPNYLVGLGEWAPTRGGQASQSVHLRGLDTRIATLIEAAQPTLPYEGFEWLRRGALSDALAWDREFGRVKDASGLGVERNLLRYRHVPVAVRASADAGWRELLRVMVAGVRTGSHFSVSTPEPLPTAVRLALNDLRVRVHVETDDEWIARVDPRPAAEPGVGEPDGADEVGGDNAPNGGAAPADGGGGTEQDPGGDDRSADSEAWDGMLGGAGAPPATTSAHAIGRGADPEPELITEEAVDDLEAVDEEDAPELRHPPRVRIVGPRDQAAELRTRLAEAIDGHPDLAIYAGEVTTAARLELLPFLREQSISITAHRYGTPDRTFDEVI